MSRKKKRRDNPVRENTRHTSGRMASRRNVVGISVGLALLVFLIYGQVATFPFINYDDPIYVTETAEVLRGLRPEGIVWAFQTTRASNWHPLTWISHMVDASLFRGGPAPSGQWAGGHHLVNVTLHAANSILLFLLLWRTTASTGRSALVAALFAVHPLHVESVAWVAERKDVLSTLLWLLTTLAYVAMVRDRQSATKRWLVPICLALGLLVKPMLVTLPFTLLLLDWWPLQRFQASTETASGPGWLASARTLLMEKWLLFVLVALSCVVTYRVQHSGGAMALGMQIDLPERIANAVVSAMAYLGKTVWPVNLAVFYPHPLNAPPWGLVLAAALALVFVSAAAVVLAKRLPYLFVGWFWYLGTLVPVIGLVQVGMQAMADRYTYIPLIGIFIAVVWGAGEVLDRVRMSLAARIAIATVTIAALAGVSFRQVGHWSTGEQLFRHTLAVTNSEANYVAQQQLGVILLESGRPAEALEHFDIAMQIARVAREPREGAAQALLLMNRPDEAIDIYRGLLEIRPDDLDVANNLAWQLATTAPAKLRNGPEAVALAERIIRQPGGRTATYLDTLAAAYAEAGRFDDAVAAAVEATQLAKSLQNRALLQDIERRLAGYRARRPAR